MAEQESGRRPTRWLTPNRIHTGALAAATAAGVVMCYVLAAPFLSALTWALTLAIAGGPAHRWLETRLKHPNLAALASVTLLAFIVMVPTTFVAERLVAEVSKGAVAVTASIDAGTWRQALDGHPGLVPLVTWIERQVDVSTTIDSLMSWLTNTSAELVRGSVAELIQVLLTFYFLFYFLRDRRIAVGLMRDLSPLSPGEMDGLFSRVVDTVYATIYGTLAGAAVQGVLGGLMFWWLGLPGPLLWGVVMALLAVVPVLGAFVVWIPTALVLALDARWGDALLLAVWGFVVVGGIDNLVYPILVGNRLRLHTVPALISIIGGVAVFGPSGLIIGPLVVAITASLLETWRTRANDWRVADEPLRQ